jgi:PRTRC genetic system protein C
VLSLPIRHRQREPTERPLQPATDRQRSLHQSIPRKTNCAIRLTTAGGDLMARLFLYDGRTFPDPDPRLTVEDVRRQLNDFFPELANADTREERRDEDTLYTFARRIGTKGGGRRRRRPPDIVAVMKSVPTRELRIFELASALLLPDGTLDVDTAAQREPELALAQAEAEAYARATQRALDAVRRLQGRS